MNAYLEKLKKDRESVCYYCYAERKSEEPPYGYIEYGDFLKKRKYYCGPCLSKKLKWYKERIKSCTEKIKKYNDRIKHLI